MAAAHVLRTFSCNRYDWSFKRGDHLHLHEFSHTQYKELTCSSFLRAFGRLDALQRHRTRIHEFDAPSQGSSSSSSQRKSSRLKQTRDKVARARLAHHVSSKMTLADDTRVRKVSQIRPPRECSMAEDEIVPALAMLSRFCSGLTPELMTSLFCDGDDPLGDTLSGCDDRNMHYQCQGTSNQIAVVHGVSSGAMPIYTSSNLSTSNFPFRKEFTPGLQTHLKVLDSQEIKPRD